MAHIEKTIPFSWKGWDEQDVLTHSYYEVEFLEDFGVFSKGEKYGSIFVDYGKGIIEAYTDVTNREGHLEVVKRQEYKATPL